MNVHIALCIRIITLHIIRSSFSIFINTSWLPDHISLSSAKRYCRNKRQLSCMREGGREGGREEGRMSETSRERGRGVVYTPEE